MKDERELVKKFPRSSIITFIFIPNIVALSLSNLLANNSFLYD